MLPAVPYLSGVHELAFASSPMELKLRIYKINVSTFSYEKQSSLLHIVAALTGLRAAPRTFGVGPPYYTSPPTGHKVFTALICALHAKR